MALQINKSVQILNSIDITTFYIRIEYSVDLSGKNISAKIFPYVSKASFEASVDNKIEIDGIDSNKTYVLVYDSATDGEMLTFIHNEIIGDLTTDKTAQVQSRYTEENVPAELSVGDLMVDENSDPIMETKIILEKFCEVSDITTTDLD